MGSGPGDPPLVGVTTSEVRPAARVEPAEHAEPPMPEMALGMKYLRSIEAAGGLPLVIPPLAPEAIDPLLDKVDAICLSGGPDLDPSTYGAEEHPELGPTEPDLDRFELAMARRADERGLPILAICRGAQALNIARGGTLDQHIPDRGASEVEHRQKDPGERATHSVEIAPGSQLERIMGTRAIEVNSFHHQAIARLGRGLNAVAWAPDGVIEAIEAPRREFLVGVQWHAEGLSNGFEQAALFSGLVDAARSSGSTKDARAA